VKPERQGKLGGEGGSCTERRGVVISMTGGVEGAERVKGAGAIRPLYKNQIWELYILPGDPTPIACGVKYLLEEDRFMCPSNWYEVCIRLSPFAQLRLGITTDYDLDAPCIIPVLRT